MSLEVELRVLELLTEVSILDKTDLIVACRREDQRSTLVVFRQSVVCWVSVLPGMGRVGERTFPVVTVLLSMGRRAPVCVAAVAVVTAGQVGGKAHTAETCISGGGNGSVWTAASAMASFTSMGVAIDLFLLLLLLLIRA